MRFLSLFVLLIGFLQSGSGAAFAQELPAPQHPLVAENANLTWKAALMTGDDSVDVFDNARKTLKREFIQMGVEPRNIKELSMSRRESKHGSRPSSADNLAGALRDLSVGDHDACLVHLTSHGSQLGLYLKNAPPLSPQKLDEILDTACGDRPTVVLVSACYSGVFVGSSMQKKNRIILTAARQDRTSFGCSAEEQYTYWDSCLIDSLPRSESWKSLYGNIQQCVQTKESGGHFIPSLPQAYFGEEVADLAIPKIAVAAFSAAFGQPPAERSRRPSGL
jgi:Peptidase C13 family